MGLAVLETERKVSSASAWAQAYQSMGRAEEREEPCETVQRVLLMSAPELVPPGGSAQAAPESAATQGVGLEMARNSM